MTFEPKLITSHRYKEGPKYRFVLTGDLAIRIRRTLGDHSFSDETGHCWLHIMQNTIFVREGYATDGCSPKFKVGPLWIGTPDFEWTRLASTIHDALYQFAHVPCFPLDRWQADCLFYELMLYDIERLNVRNKAWARLCAGGYRNAVMSAGIPFYHWGTLTKGRNGFCRKHYIPT